MLTRPARWWLCLQPTDMRGSFMGLAALVRQHLGEDPSSGAGFVFVNRRGTQLKCLYFDGDGYRVWAKRLEQGQFTFQPGGRPGAVALSGTAFQALLGGNRPFDGGLRAHPKPARRRLRRLSGVIMEPGPGGVRSDPSRDGREPLRRRRRVDLGIGP